MKLTFNLDFQKISRTDKNTVVAGSKNYVFAKFTDVSGDWTAPITAIFGEYSVILDENNQCTVPWEVLQNSGSFEVSAFCGDLHTANKVIVNVEESGYKEGETPQPPTPDVYSQILTNLENAVPSSGEKGYFLRKGDGVNEWAEVEGSSGGGGAQIDDSSMNDSSTWSSLNIVNMLCPYFSMNGPMVTCYPVMLYPLSLSLNIDAVQNGQLSAETPVPINGFSSVELRTGGKNLCPISSLESPYYNYLLPRETFPTLYEAMQNLKPGEQYRIGWTVTYSDTGQQATGDVKELQIYYTNGEYVAFRPNNQSNEVLDADIDSIRIYSGNFEVKSTRRISEIMFEQASGAVGTYEDFSGETKSIDLGRTVYGGTLNVVTGELTVTHENIASYNGEDVGDDWISSTGELTIGAQVVYRLAEPEHYNIKQNDIIAIEGTNVIFCDSGDVTVSGRTVSSNVPVYSGTYSVDPMVTSQVLNTGGKYLEQDVLINTIPLNETPNDSGGVTITIGGE